MTQQSDCDGWKQYMLTNTIVNDQQKCLLKNGPNYLPDAWALDALLRKYNIIINKADCAMVLTVFLAKGQQNLNRPNGYVRQNWTVPFSGSHAGRTDNAGMHKLKQSCYCGV